MRSKAFVLLVLAVVLHAAALSAHEMPGRLVLNGDLTAVLKTAEGTQQVSGRLSGYLTLSGESLERGARIEGFNVALFGVDQQAITGKATRGKPTGVVGFAALAEGDQRQSLRYDSRARALVGKIRGRVDLPQVYELAPLRINPEDDLVELPTLEATLDVRIGVGELDDLSQARDKAIETRLEVALHLSIDGAAALVVRPVDLSAQSRLVDAKLAFFPWLEVARQLCIQPVRIYSLGLYPFFHFSGDGLPFGQPGANAQWAKADVVFEYRNWLPIFQSQFATFTSGEAADLLATLDVDDCIEVFFVDRFSPQGLWGGGGTFGLGLASSKVISSDELADFGVDLTHLAHEFGHVLGLIHPGNGSNSSTNTLMCPSGFNNDNPKRNSLQNMVNLSNPLLTFAFKLVTPGPNCQNSADCGACPPVN